MVQGQNTGMMTVNWAKADVTHTSPMTVNPMRLAAFKGSQLFIHESVTLPSLFISKPSFWSLV